MIKLILVITGDKGIGVELKSEAVDPTPQEKLFAQQFGKTIADFLSQAEPAKPASDN
jgi:hypothetical protein